MEERIFAHTTIHELYEQHILSALDFHFAQFIGTLSNSRDTSLLLAAALTSYAHTHGHICFNLAQPYIFEQNVSLRLPDVKAWQNALLHSNVVGRANEFKPLILDQQRLYLQRYWQYEQQLISSIQQRLHQSIPNNLVVNNDALITTKQLHKDQMAAIATAISHYFCIISGGPGTGKTSTVVNILLQLVLAQPQLRIALTAPTGKAATRLQETINTVKQTLTHPIAEQLPQQAMTIHRLLGVVLNSPYFKHNADNLLPYDVVVVDEASMIDLPLMTKLAHAIPLTSRWILLGDKDQLASVEAGTVLGDLCEVGLKQETTSELQGSITLLTKSYRFNQEQGIGALAEAVKQGHSQKALHILKSTHYPEVDWLDLNDCEDFVDCMAQHVLSGFVAYLKEKKPQAALAKFNRFRVLCALRHGRYGVVTINRLIEYLLRQHELIPTQYQWYHGKPIMITQNDYTLNLFNGDVGITLWNEQNELQVFFPMADGEIRSFLPTRLPAHETVYAMTIHKSQGSEFDNVFMLLPQQSSPILTRELVYTGITRAKSTVSVWGTENVLKQAIRQKVERYSGIHSLLG